MLLKGPHVPDTFYPFVENGGEQDESVERSLDVRHPARIAVYDDAAAAPRVVVVEPSDIRSYLEEITATVTRLAQEQGGRIPFTVIREVVENLIHAYFIEPTVSILDGGDTIRFSDQGPGITDKHRALEYGTTSATGEMKRYIRGVGSGLPYAQQWLQDKGGSLTVEDNMRRGTIVTISLVQDEAEDQQVAADGAPARAASPEQMNHPSAAPITWQPQYPTQYPQPAMPMGTPPQNVPYLEQQPYAAPQPQQTPAWPTPTTWQQTYPAQPGPPAVQPPAPPTPPQVSERGMRALEYLRTHESVGPRDLNAWHPLSESTWSRVLSQLEGQGLVSKQGGQKRHLTEAGRRLLGL